jgi:hypothetical protein
MQATAVLDVGETHIRIGHITAQGAALYGAEWFGQLREGAGVS